MYTLLLYYTITKHANMVTDSDNKVFVIIIGHNLCINNTIKWLA